jgi:hypothetical protein
VAGELVARFREREEGVKGDVFAAYVALLEAVREGGRRYTAADPSRCAGLLLRGGATGSGARAAADAAPVPLWPS